MSPSRLVFLAIETTCDETGAAVLEGPRPPATGVPRVLSSVVASQVGLHQRVWRRGARDRLKGPCQPGLADDR